MNCQNNIGIMGGTFNPVHLGHLKIAQMAMQQFSLSKVWFMPNKIPEYKQSEDIAAEQHRVSMVKLAIKGYENFEFSSFELQREGFTYTYETLLLLKELYPDNTFYFIMGADSLDTFTSWKRPEIIADNCIILVAQRDDIDKNGMDCKIKNLNKLYNAKIYKVDGELIDISSSKIRNMLNNNENVSSILPQSVLEYIKKYNLYSS